MIPCLPALGRHALRLAILLALLAAGAACRGRAIGSTGDVPPLGEDVPFAPQPAEGTDEAVTTDGAATRASGMAARAEVEPGPYAGDERVEQLFAAWPEIVADAADRLALVTGLTLPPDRAPRVILGPLGDETREWTTESEVRDGRRVPLVRVNLEPIAAGREPPRRVAVRALATAVFEDAARGTAGAAPWVVRTATILAGGDLDARLVDLRRRTEASPLRVDPGSEAAAETTALAALLVLLEGGDPDALRRFVLFAAEGDDPDAFLARTLRDPLGQWAGTGRDLLAKRLATIDVSAWAVLERARRTLEEAGRAAMEAALPPEVPGEILGELTLLRARARMDEGDYAEAQRLLDTLPEDTAARLDDPAAAATLRVRAARGAGRTAEAARREAEWRRDYPRAARRTGGEVGAPPGLDPAGLDTVERDVRRLLAAHRAGAARRLLEGLGERSRAPELVEVAREVARAEQTPSPEAVAACRERVRAWRQAPSPETEAAVRDGGAASAVALAEVAEADGVDRRAVVRLLAEAGGPGRAVELLAPTWRRRGGLVAGDLDALLGVARYAELKVWAEGHAADVVGGPEAEALWERLRYGLDPTWVRTHGDVLRDLRSPTYARRRAAFDEAVRAGQVTPELVARGLGDPAPLLRREAATVGGRYAFTALVQLALTDDAWVVRQAACPASVEALGPAAADRLLPLYRDDPVPQVRLAALRALGSLASSDARLIGPLVAGLATDDGALAEETAAQLATLDRRAVGEAVLEALRAEVAQRAPRVPYVSRLFLVLQRATGRDTGYYAGMAPEEVRALVRRWARAASGLPPPGRDGR